MKNIREMSKKKKIIAASVIALLICFGVGFFALGGFQSDDTSVKADNKKDSNVTVVEKDGEKITVDEDGNEVKVNKDGSVEIVKENAVSKSTVKKATSSSSNTTKPSSPGNSGTHKHSWVAQYEQQDNGYYEYIYKTRYWDECNACGADITGNIEAHHKGGCMSGWTNKSQDILVDKVWHENVDKTYIGDKCSACGQWR